MRVPLCAQTAQGATAQLTPDQWRQLAARLPVVCPTTPIVARVQLAVRITAAVEASSSRPVRLRLSAAELALVEAAAEGFNA